jgi:O-antigen/teichoic acid export membrane protein
MSALPGDGGGPAAAVVAPLRTLTAWSAIASLAQALARLGSVVILAQLLSPREAGAVVYGLWLAGTALMLSGAGLGGALQRFLAELDGRGEHQAMAGLASWAARRFAGLLLAGALALAALLPFLGSELGSGRLWTLPLLLALQGFEALGAALLSGQRRFTEIALRSLVASALTLGAVALGAAAAGVDGALCGFALGSLPLALRGAGALLAGAPATPVMAPEPALARRFWRYALMAWIATIASSVIWTRMELVFIERFQGVAAVAVYGMALTWAAIASQLPALGLGALLPHFAARCGGGDGDGLARTYTQASRLMALVSIPLGCGAALFTPRLLPLVFGSAYGDAVPSSMILCALATAGFASVGTALFYGLDRSHIILRTSVASALLALLLDLLVIPRWGLLGAALLRAAFQASSVAFTLWYLGRHCGVRTPYGALARIAAAAALAGVPWWAAGQPGTGWAGLLLGGLAGLLVYLAGVRLLRVLAPEDHALAGALARGLPVGARRALAILIGGGAP